MEALINYFGNISSAHRGAFIVGGIMFFWLIENAAPLFSFNYKKWNHAGLNIFFTLTTIIVNLPLAFMLLKVSDWTIGNGFGLLNILPEINIFLFTILGLLFLDLIGAYTVHLVEHKVKWMWRFHMIHHSDLHIDTTSANRHHPGESVFRLVFTTLAVFIVGAPMWLVFLYQTLSVVLSQFNHANIKMPVWFENTVSWVLVTPKVHHVHHHYTLPYTDANYGNIFSIWDRLFGTFLMLKDEEIVYGLDTIMDPKENQKLGPLLKLPFQTYRPPLS